jgi:hypothetical protein
MEPDGDSPDEDERKEKRRCKVNMSPQMILLVRSYYHQWGKDGKHVGFRKQDDVVEHMQKDFGLGFGASTLKEKMQKEKNDFSRGGGLRERPTNMEELLAEMEREREAEKKDVSMRGILSNEEKELLKAKVLRLKGFAGFGPLVVKTFAKEIYSARKEIDPSFPDWEPCQTWCYDFMKTHLNMVHKRVTQRKVIVEPAKMQDLTQLLMETLARDLVGVDGEAGVPWMFFYTSDETGVHLMPQTSSTWSEKGGKDAVVYAKEDKKQYTADIVLNTKGFVCLQLIFEGKTDRSLPKTAIPDNWIIGNTTNHWSDLNQKKKLIEKTYELFLRDLDQAVQDNQVPACLKDKICMVHLLDCWPVNTSEAFRSWVAKTFPRIKIRYIPAGSTGEIQIGDTHIHAGYKKLIMQLFEKWWGSVMISYTEKLERKEWDQQKFAAEMNKLTGAAILREKASGVQQGCNGAA